MEFRPTMPTCPQCGLAHPPIPGGDKCPMAVERAPSGEEINTNELFTVLKNVIVSNIQKKNIKDQKKFYGNIIIEVTKLCENYKE